MSSFEDDDGPFKGNSSESGEEPFKTPVKNVRFGIVELCIFMGLWIVMIVIFKLYTKSQRRQGHGWFGENEEKILYEQLLEKEPSNEEALKKALVRRCMTDVRRLMKLQEERDSVMSLSRSGAISEEMLSNFKLAEKELELELFEVQAEAETFKEGWSQEIVRDSVRLSKIEDELVEVKRRKEREERRKIEESERKERDSARAEKASLIEEEEKKKLLEELLEEDKTDSSPRLLKKRTSSVGGKK